MVEETVGAQSELQSLRHGRAAALYEAARAEYAAIRWEDPLPVPRWIYVIRAALSAPRDDDGGFPGLTDRRFYHTRRGHRFDAQAW